jgi:hypothetical protein
MVFIWSIQCPEMRAAGCWLDGYGSHPCADFTSDRLLRLVRLPLLI